jgi:hypothetical protein
MLLKQASEIAKKLNTVSGVEATVDKFSRRQDSFGATARLRTNPSNPEHITAWINLKTEEDLTRYEPANYYLSLVQRLLNQ